MARSSAQAQRNQEAKDARRRADTREVIVPPVADQARRDDAANDPFLFLQTYLPDKFSRPFDMVGKEIVTSICHAAQYSGDQAIAAPRGVGKSAIVEGCLIYLLNTARIKFPVIFGASGDDAKEMLRNIKREYEGNKLLLEDYPEICAPIWALGGAANRAGAQTVHFQRTFIRWTGDVLEFPRVWLPEIEDWAPTSDSAFAIRGLDASIRGLRIGNQRPDVAIIDDPETEESAVSDVQTEKREKVIERAIGGLGSSSKRISRLILTTCQNRSPCLSFKFTDPKQKPSWRGKVFKFLESFPKRVDHWERYVELRKAAAEDDPFFRAAHNYYVDNREAMDEDAVENCPDCYDSTPINEAGEPLELSATQHYYNLQADNGEGYVLTELQNDPPEDEGTKIVGATADVIKQRVNGFPRGFVPDEVLYLTAGIDIGKYFLHWTVTGWTENAQGWVIDYGAKPVVHTNRADEDAVEQAIYTALHDFRDGLSEEPYTRDNKEVDVALALVDSGKWADAIYGFCIDCGQQVYSPCHGVGETGVRRAKIQTLTSNDTDKKRLGEGLAWYRQNNGLWLCMPDADYWKAWVNERFLTSPGRPGSITVFGDDPADHLTWIKQLTAEQPAESFVKGKGLTTTWVKVRRDNHYLDALYMSAAAASCLGVSILPTKQQEQQQQQQEQEHAEAIMSTLDGRDFLETARL